MYNKSGTHVFYIIKYMCTAFLKKARKMDAIGMLSAITGPAQIFNRLSSRMDSQQQQQYNLDLMQKQSQYNKEAVDYQRESEMKMFNDTGYDARVKQIKDAGLNPALIYSMGAGSGGGVTGNISAPQVSQPNAPNVTGNTANANAVSGMMLQLAKMASDIQVNKSIVEVNEAEAALKEKQQPVKLEAETNLLGEQTIGQKIKNQFDQINLMIKDQTKFADVDTVLAKTEEAKQDALKATADTKVATETVQTRIAQYNQELLNTIGETSVKWSEKRLNDQEATKLKADVINIAKQWELRQMDQTIDIEKIKNSFNECLMNNMTHMDVAKLNGIMGMIQKLIPSQSIVKPR